MAARGLAVLMCCGAFGSGTLEGQAPDRVLERSWDAGPEGPLVVDRGATGVWQRLQKLGNTASVLYTAGHPDDEEAGVLTLLSRGRGVRTALLTLNRGEGGANAIGPELFDALGLIRSEELRSAGRYYGLDDQYFTTAVDYGYSKTLAEALRSWDREAILGDMVRIIRLNRPLVVVSRWHGSDRDGHGHHQASGVLTPEAVEAAADPLRFPEQIRDEGLRPWRAHKVYRGRLLADEPAHLEVDPNVPSPWLGTTYGDFGMLGLSLQRSQTSGRLRRAGTSRYERLSPAGGGSENDFFDGLDTSLTGIFQLVGEPPVAAAVAALARAEEHVGRATDAFTLTNPSAASVHLVEVRRSLAAAATATPAASDARFLIDIERAEVDEALEAAIGISLAATATPAGTDPTATMGSAMPGQELDVRATLSVAGAAALELLDLRVLGAWGDVTFGTERARTVPARGQVTTTLRAQVPEEAEPSRPWFYRSSFADNTYSVRDSVALHLGESPPPLRIVATVRFLDATFEVSEPVRAARSNPPFGRTHPPLIVTPSVTVRTTTSAVILDRSTRSAAISVDVTSSTSSTATGTVAVQLPEGWTSAPARHPWTPAGSGGSERLDFVVTAPRGVSGPSTLEVVVRLGDRNFAEGFQEIDHADLTPTQLYSRSTITVTAVDAVAADGLRVGYIMGVGDDVPTAIEQLGADVSLLSEDDLARGDLGRFHTVVVGTRAYAVRADLVAHNARLLEYAAQGGNLLVLYQTQEYVPERQAAFTASLPRGAEEVSEEDAPVTVLAPDHPLLTTPNSIGAADFDGWIEQRGSKFFASWSPEYTPLIETHDTGQAPQRGVWLTARAGEGYFTYASIALHRQVPYGVPGAFRILANLISLGR